MRATEQKKEPTLETAEMAARLCSSSHRRGAGLTRLLSEKP